MRTLLAIVSLLVAAPVAAQTDGLLGAYAFSDSGAAGRFGSGLLFSGGANGRQLPVTGVSSAFTFESWIKPSSFVWSDLWKQEADSPGGNAIFTLCVTDTGAVYFSAYQGAAAYPIFTIPTLQLNTWTHVAVTYDGTQIRIYFDAVEVGRRNASGSVIPSSQPMDVGAQFLGRIDEVRIYGRALTANEIALDRATPIDPLEPFQISAVTPADAAPGVSTTPVTVTFSAPANVATVTPATFELADAAGAVVPAGVSYDASSRTATLAPASPLSPLADYTVRVVGGSSGVTDGVGSTLGADTVWRFRTAASPATPRLAFAFSEGAGGSASDLSGNGNAGVLLHGAAWSPGMYGNGVRFDGINDDIQVPSRDTTTLTNAFTFEAWVKPATRAWGYLWSQYPDNEGNVLNVLAITNTGALYTAPYLSGTNYPMFTTATLPVNAWTHVAVTYDGALLRIYVEGLEVASRAAHGALPATPEPVELGQWFQGSMDEVRIYGRALSPGEIAIDRQTPIDANQVVISSLAPGSGSSGQSVTITGINFGSTQDSSPVSTVTFNGIVAAVTAWSATSVVAVVPPGATSGPVVVTRQGTPSNGVTFTLVGPRISATVSPLPNAFGWNNSNVTVTFTCAATDSPISFCTSPQTVSWNGAGIRITGRAIDQNGVTATMVATLNVDLAGPALRVYSPATSTVFPTGTVSVTLNGSSVDVTSGLAVITCAGVPATFVGQNFSCPAAVQDGTNSIHLEAQDVAGRVTAQNVSVVVGDIPPAALFLSPATTTLLAGWGQALAVTDDRGRTVAGGTWSTSAQNVATVSVDAGVPVVSALATGTATVTLTRDGLSAQAVVTVLASDAVPVDGTTLWSLLPTPTTQPGLTPGVREVVRAVRPFVQETSINQPPALFFVERGPYSFNADTTAIPSVIRAVTADGREVWKYTLPADPVFGGYSPVRQVAPDDRGGLVMLVASSRPACCYQPNEVIRRIDGFTGEVSWEYWHRETNGRFSEFAIHPDGNIYVVEKLSNADSTELVALDGLTGAVESRYDLTDNHHTYPNGSNATGPVILDDGSIVAVVSRWDNQSSGSTTPKSAWLASLPGGSTFLSLQQLVHADGSAVNLGIGDVMSGPWPDGHGGFIVGDISASSTSGFANLVHIGADRVTSPTIDLPFGASAARDLQYILGEDAAYVLVQYWPGSGQTGARSYKVDPVSLGILDSTNLQGGPNVQWTSAMAGGGTLFSSHLQGDASQIGYRLLGGWSNDVPLVQVGATATVAETNWPQRRGVASRNDASNPRLGIFVKAQIVFPPFLHTSLRVVPKNQSRWAGTPGFRQNPFGDWYLTIGAESNPPEQCSGLLQSDLNRPSDLDPTNFVYRERLQYSLSDEDTIVQGLLQADSNYLDDLFYACFPSQADDTYNSNSYTHGLLDKAGLPSPITPFLVPYFHPGWRRPVPSTEFDAAQ